MNLVVYSAVIFVVLTNHVNAKIFTPCSLARELHRQGIPKSEIPDWVCLAEGESTFNTEAVNRFNSDGSYDWGLFQLNDRYWCKPTTEGRLNWHSSNACNINCETLLSDDITETVKCARKIKKAHGGFSAWVAWNNKCQGNHKLRFKKCFQRK